jgi:hypothetical protein
VLIILRSTSAVCRLHSHFKADCGLPKAHTGSPRGCPPGPPRHVALTDTLASQATCVKERITGYPSIRIYRRGSDTVVQGGLIQHESYHGDRTADALEAFIDQVVATEGKSGAAARVPYTRKMTLAEGCQARAAMLLLL